MLWKISDSVVWMFVTCLISIFQLWSTSLLLDLWPFTFCKESPIRLLSFTCGVIIATFKNLSNHFLLPPAAPARQCQEWNLSRPTRTVAHIAQTPTSLASLSYRNKPQPESWFSWSNWKPQRWSVCCHLKWPEKITDSGLPDTKPQKNKRGFIDFYLRGNLGRTHVNVCLMTFTHSI